MSLTRLISAISATAATADAAASRISADADAIEDDARRAITAVLSVVPTAANMTRGLRARGTASSPSPLIPEVLAPDSPLGSDKRTAIFDEEDDLASYVPRQGAAISELLQNPILAQLLEGYARIVQYLETNRGTSAESIRDREELRRSLTFVERRIKELGGATGRKFSFEQLERDLINALKREVTTTVRAALPSSPTGKSDRCNGPSLFVLQSAGVIR